MFETADKYFHLLPCEITLKYISHALLSFKYISKLFKLKKSLLTCHIQLYPTSAFLNISL
jgi:hypothetical protein